MAKPPETLTEKSFTRAVRRLVRADPGLGAIVASAGEPPFWVRSPGFPTLVHIILEQQVSLASALAAYDRLTAAAGKLTPERLLALPDEALRGAGLSRQKARYCRIAAEAVLSGALDLPGLSALPDDEVRLRLTALTGIGPWTADVYLQMALRRPDVWPAGDIALQTAVQKYYALDARPATAEMPAYGEKWRPVRTVAASILWHGYLNPSAEL